VIGLPDCRSPIGVSSGHIEALRHVDRIVVDRFYHAMHPFLSMNVGEDTCRIEGQVGRIDP
jgi:hypothetical protein